MLSTFVLALAACDGLTGPSLPEVAGTYTGPVTLGATVVFQGVPDTILANGSMTVVVEQDVDQVTLSGSMTILGDTESLDTISGTINEAGVWTETGAETGAFVFDDDECGYALSAAVKFSGGSLTIEITATRSEPTIDCPNITMSGDLSRT
jgi:hypothetical protein